MSKELLKKLDMFIESRVIGDEPTGMRPIQFLKWWNGFRPGDRVDVDFGEDYINMAGTNAEGNFAGIKKEFDLDNEEEIEEFKNSEGNIWFFV